jgi:WhiB family redox-sensing transcriptional regulator
MEGSPMSANDPWWLRGIGDTDWMRKGVCSQTDPEAFFPDQGRNDLNRQAKAVCSTCPVMDRCAAYALALPGIEGIWGGLSERDRESIRRNGRAA